jgi:hypothetical protein
VIDERKTNNYRLVQSWTLYGKLSPMKTSAKSKAKTAKPQLKVRDLKTRKNVTGGRKAGEGQKDFLK